MLLKRSIFSPYQSELDLKICHHPFQSRSMLLQRMLSLPRTGIANLVPLGSCWLGRTFFNTKSPSLNCLGQTFLLWARIILFWYNWPWLKVDNLFSSIRFNCSYLVQTHSASSNFVSIKTLQGWYLHLYWQDYFYTIN